MRVNIYAEEMTDRVEIIEKETPEGKFTGLRFYLALPVTHFGLKVGAAVELQEKHGSRTNMKFERSEHGTQISGPFIHRPGDDDSAAVTFWGKSDLRDLLVKALKMLDDHYGVIRR